MTTLHLLQNMADNLIDRHGDAIQRFILRRMDECLTAGDVDSFLLWESIQNMLNCLRNQVFSAADTLH